MASCATTTCSSQASPTSKEAAVSPRPTSTRRSRCTRRSSRTPRRARPRPGKLPALGARGLGERASRYFARMEKLMRVLQALSRQELANQPLSANGQRFLAAVVELYALTAIYVNTWSARYDGWYFDLFFGDVQAGSEFIASVFTHPRNGTVEYVGARTPELGFLVVDTGGPPRLMVGPVARGFVAVGPLAGRFDDEQVARDLPPRRFVDAPWSASYRPAEKGYVALRQTDESRFDATSTAGGRVTFRARGEHGVLLWSTSRPAERAANARGVYSAKVEVPGEILSRARVVSAESHGVIAEARVLIRVPSHAPGMTQKP
ncbi:MAG: DUF3160 domain-containing protein [Myxococcales bacterium]